MRDGQLEAELPVAQVEQRPLLRQDGGGQHHLVDVVENVAEEAGILLGEAGVVGQEISAVGVGLVDGAALVLLDFLATDGAEEVGGETVKGVLGGFELLLEDGVDIGRGEDLVAGVGVIDGELGGEALLLEVGVVVEDQELAIVFESAHAGPFRINVIIIRYPSFPHSYYDI